MVTLKVGMRKKEYIHIYTFNAQGKEIQRQKQAE